MYSKRKLIILATVALGIAASVKAFIAPLVTAEPILLPSEPPQSQESAPTGWYFRPSASSDQTRYLGEPTDEASQLPSSEQLD